MVAQGPSVLAPQLGALVTAAEPSPIIDARTPAFAVGDVIGGTLVIRGLLGKGGMGQVFEAYDQSLHRIVAVKVAWPHAVASVRDEAQALAALRHPSIIAVYGVGTHAGVEYVVMERIHGLTLEAHLQQRRRERSRLAMTEVIRLLLAIADALAFVHAAGIAHRDVKPDNVMLAGQRVVLTDFGIFRPESRLSHEAILLGSPLYMAPETIRQAVGVGEAWLVDIYALGVVAFELLTGMPPFSGKNEIAVFEQQLTAPPPDPMLLRPDTPPRLAQLTQSMLAKDPRARPQGADEVAWQLRRLSTEANDDSFRVVVAEDNPATAKIVRAVVESAVPEAEVYVAPDGAAALQLVQRWRAPLVVVDLNLPGMSGVELCMRLRESDLTSGCTVLCTSAQTDDSQIARLREIGLRWFAPKGEELLRHLPDLALQLWRCWRLAHPPRTGVRRKVL
jgi:serine/threonine-protein kinase